MSKKDNDNLGGLIAGIAGLAGLGVATYAALKKRKNNKVSNTAKALETFYCNFSPALAVYIAFFSHTHFYNSQIDEYVNEIYPALYNDNNPSHKAQIRYHVQEALEAALSEDFDSLSKKIRKYLRENDLYDSAVLSCTFFLFEGLNAVGFDVAAGLFHSENLVMEAALDRGWDRDEIKFSSSKYDSYGIPDYDIMNFKKMPADELYGIHNIPLHLGYARLAPAMAVLATRFSNIDIHATEYTAISATLFERLEEENESYPQGTFCLTGAEVCKKTLKATNLESLENKIITALEKNFDQEMIVSIVKFATSVTKTLNGDGFAFLYRCCSFLGKDEFGRLMEESGYEGFKDYYSRFSSGQDGNSHTADGKSTEYYLGILGLDIDATWDDVVSAHKRMMLFFHPDNYQDNDKKRSQAEEQSKRINAAFDELKKRMK